MTVQERLTRQCLRILALENHVVMAAKLHFFCFGDEFTRRTNREMARRLELLIELLQEEERKEQEAGAVALSLVILPGSKSITLERVDVNAN